MKVLIKRDNHTIKFFIGEPLSAANKYAKKHLKLQEDDTYCNEADNEGASYMYLGKAVIWVHEEAANCPINLYKTLFHEILHVCFHLDQYWEDDEPPARYDACIKSEASFIGMAESLFGEVLTKIVKKYGGN
tara:strand:+ start:679 stop:1074 length:396 start_codon:yes stop_codon:yes gene_type:complete